MNKLAQECSFSPGAKTRIAILGATSHIAKGLIQHFIYSNDNELFLFARQTLRLREFLDEIDACGVEKTHAFQGFDKFGAYEYDVVINCIGLGTVAKELGIYTSFFLVTEEFDNLIIRYLLNSSRTLYINLSSGAIYGNQHREAAEESTINKISVNKLSRDDSFMVAKLNSEAKHRAFEKLNIIDIRIFSYFSRFIDISGNYFLTDLLRALANKQIFYTDRHDIIRDYLHPSDLYALVRKCIEHGSINSYFDAYSRQSIRKQEILDYFSLKYNLNYKIIHSHAISSVTGHKLSYFSTNCKANEIGYSPMYSSIETISLESEYILKKLSDHSSCL